MFLRKVYILMLLLLVSACVSIPAELKYTEPMLPLGSVTVLGSMQKNKGLLTANDYLSMFAIDGLLVNGVNGASWKKPTRMTEGKHTLELHYSQGDRFVGGVVIPLEAKAFTEYTVKFDYPYSPTKDELKQFWAMVDFERPKPSLWGKVWIINITSGETVGEHALLPIDIVVTTTIPIFI